MLLITPDHTMVSFVKPNLLGTQKEFKNQFVHPITNGQCQDSSPADVRFMKNRAHVLHDMLKETVQVRSQFILLNPYLVHFLYMYMYYMYICMYYMYMYICTCTCIIIYNLWM